MRIILPWPNRGLSPNARGHWRKRAQLAQSAKSTAAWSVREQIEATANQQVAAIPRPLALVMTFHAPDRRRRDRDNLLSSMKPAIDGMCDALGIDDSEFRRVTATTGAPMAGGMVTADILEDA